MKRTDLIKSVALGAAIVLVFGGAMAGLNMYTGPLIEANRAGEKFGPLLAVMPEGASFDGDALIYSADGSAGAQFADVPQTVTAIYREADGAGYAVQVTAESSYSQAPMEITLGVDAEGRIIRAQIDAYHDTQAYDFRVKDPAYLDTYVGKDSALADVGAVVGATYSSTAFKTGVQDAMKALTANGLVAEGVKGDDQLLQELIPAVFPGMASGGIVKAEDIEPSGSMTAAMKAQNDSGFAYIMSKDGETLMACVNASGVCRVFDAAGGDVTDANAGLVKEAVDHAAAHQKDYSANAAKRFGKMMENAGDMTPVSVPAFGTIVAAAAFEADGKQYYGFYSRSYGYEDMDVYVIVDETGAIAAVDAKAILFDTEYFPVAKDVDQAAYKKSFRGLTAQSWTGETAVISGATMTSNAMKQTMDDVFEAFEAVKNGGAEQ